MNIRLLRFTMLILAVLISATGAWADDAKPNLNYNENGGYYEIASAEDMITFANFCRAAKSPTCVGMTFKVTTNELDLGTDDFKRITGEFGGTFDGQGVVLKNIHQVSLFETIKGGTVMNITLDASCYWEGSRENSIGGIATNNEGGTISGCTNNAKAKGYARTSGIVNYNHKGTVKDCVNNGTIEGGSGNAAGIVGDNEGGTIIGCVNNGTIIGKGGYCGGIAGTSTGKDIVTISNCRNNGHIQSSGQNTGGIVGSHGEKGTIQDCTNSGDVESRSYLIGGIAGGSGGIIIGCTNSGRISGRDTNNGGITGANTGEVRNCTNTGDVSGDSYCGGISGRSTGKMFDSQVSDCTISAISNLYAGAILGTRTHGILSENYYTSNVNVVVNSASTPKTYSGSTPRGRGATGYQEIYDPDDLYEMEVDGKIYYNGAVVKLNSGEGTFNLIYMVDNEVYKTYTLAYNEVITPEPAPTKEGYTFSGWSEIPERMPAKDVTVTGTFTVNTYKLTYMVDGEVHATYNIEYGKTITAEAEPKKEGYTFSGWSEIPETMPAKDVTITGSFIVNMYKLTYYVDGEVYKTCEIEYSATITPEAAPEKEGYTFTEWKGLPETMPAKDVDVTAVYYVNTYMLTYMVDGEVYATYNIEYGKAITAETEPKKEGYTFSGWSEIPETMPAHDVTVEGSFTILPTIYLVVWTKNGEQAGYALNKRPVLKFTETEMIISGEDIDVIYALDNFARYTYSDQEPTVIKDIRTDEAKARFEGESLIFPSLKANNTISVYTLNGVQIIKKTVHEDGEYAFPLSALRKGVYLVNVNGLTYKIAKK